MTEKVCDLILMIYFLLELLSQSLISVSIDPTARYLELGEKAQQLNILDFYLMLELKRCYANFYYGLAALTRIILPSWPQLAITLSI